MTQAAAQTEQTISAEILEREIRARIDSLSYLPSAAAVAMKFVELGQNPEAEPSEYARVIGSDSSLSAKILALVNSSWYAVRQNVTSVPMAVNLLGLGTVRTLAISYCMAGLHNSLKLTPDESKMFWEATLYKAVAAKQFVMAVDEKLGDPAFAAGLFQDFAIPVMFAVAKDPLMAVLQDGALNWQAQLTKERELFHLDHAEIGRVLAEKMELPELFVDAVAFHHNYAHLSDFMDRDGMVGAVYAASLFPHVLSAWNQKDIDELNEFLGEHGKNGMNRAELFLESVQEEFDRLYQYFENGETPESRLVELMSNAAAEAADDTTRLVSHVDELMQNAAIAGMQMNEVVNSLQDKAARDPLTGLMNREGFENCAVDMLDKAARYKAGVAVIYFDLDRFKSVNDSLGHEFGDLALKRVAACMIDALRQHDLVGRMGGDEFVTLLYDCDEQQARQIASRVVAQVAAEEVRKGKRSASIALSAGLVWHRRDERSPNLESLVSTADRLMYKAKRSGGNRIAVGAP